MNRYPIPTDALDDRLAFVGTSGSGKTYAAGTAVEKILNIGGLLPPDQMHDNPSCRNRGRHAQAGIEHPCARAHRPYLNEEASVATSDQPPPRGPVAMLVHGASFC